jgi:hypothetical protein
MRLETLSKILLLLLIVLLSAACTNRDLVPFTEIQTPTVLVSSDDVNEAADTASRAYPADTEAEAREPGYPAPRLYEDLLSTPPNPPIELPAAEISTGVVGGVLIREVSGYGFKPLVPASISLGEVLLTSDGRPAFVRAADNSPKAELFPTGIFIFRDVLPGEYGIMVDVGYTIFPIREADGTPRLITIQAGDVLDLGQVITELPTE